MNLRLYGNVKDTKTDKPVIGASIRLYLKQEELQKVETVKNGFYEIILQIDDSRIETGQQLRIVFEKTGYQTQEHHVLATEGAFNLDIALKEAVSPQTKKTTNWLPVIISGCALLVALIAGVIALKLLLANKSPMSRYSLNAADGTPVDAVYVDNEGNVGIGTTNPGHKLHVNGDIYSTGTVLAANETTDTDWIESEGNIYRESGNVGIGTMKPEGTLHIKDNAAFPNGILIEKKGGSPRLGLIDTSLDILENAPAWYIDNYGDRFRIFRQPNIKKGGLEFFTIKNNGNMGIGTSDPSHLFHVRTKDAVGLFESTGSQAYLRLSTKEGFNRRVEFTNRPGGRASIWVSEGGDAFNVLRDGKVGIGTTNPGAKLEVVGTVKLNDKTLSGTGLTCKDVQGNKSGTADDAPSYASCPSGYTLTGCTCYSPWNSCDGARPDRGNNRCIAYNNYKGQGVYAEATCCKVH